MPRLWLACLAALSVVFTLASAGLCKPPDLPRYERITVLPNGVESLEPHLLATFGLMSNYPIQILQIGDPVTTGGSGRDEIRELPVPVPFRFVPRPEPNSVGQCPYPHGVPAPFRLIDPVATRSVMDNLKLLEQAAEQIEKARRLARTGKMSEAVEQLEKVRQLLPGSSCEKRAEELLQEIAAEEQQGPRDQSPLAGGCGAVSQFGMCWAGQVFDWMSKAEFEGYVQKARAQLALRKTTKANGAGQRVVVCVEIGASGCPVVLDVTDMEKGGPCRQTPVVVEGHAMPICGVLNVMLRPRGLEAKFVGGVIVIGSAAKTVDSCKMTEKDDPAACEENACPKCQRLHEQHAGKKEMVNGLMKACRLAIAQGRHEKAADLARQAHALDPQAVESDPMVIKLDLLNQYRGWQPNGKKKSPTGDAEEQEEDGSNSLMPEVRTRRK